MNQIRGFLPEQRVCYSKRAFLPDDAQLQIIFTDGFSSFSRTGCCCRFVS